MQPDFTPLDPNNLTPIQRELYDRLLLRNGGDKAYTDLDWKLVEAVVEEASDQKAAP
jgi:hypothetical protein